MVYERHYSFSECVSAYLKQMDHFKFRDHNLMNLGLMFPGALKIERIILFEPDTYIDNSEKYHHRCW